MRHRIRGRHFSRTSSHRRAMRRNLACNLFLHERIRTTPEKAKDTRAFVERLITLGRKDSVANFRRALALLDDKYVVRKLFREIGPRYVDRPGGYTRILKLDESQNRLGDNAKQVLFELVGEGEGEHTGKEKERRRSRRERRLGQLAEQEKAAQAAASGQAPAEGEAPPAQAPEAEESEAQDEEDT